LLRDGMKQLTALMDQKLITPAQWADMMILLAENSGDAATQIRLLNEYMNRLKDKTITLTVNTVGLTNIPGVTITPLSPPGTHNRPRKPGQTSRTAGGEAFNEGLTVWGSPTTTQTETVINNNFVVTMASPINIRELARQITREQQRAGVT